MGRPFLWSHVVNAPECYRPGKECSTNKRGQEICGIQSTGAYAPYRSVGWVLIEPGTCRIVDPSNTRHEWYYYVVSTDGAVTLPPRDSTQNVFLIPIGQHDECTTNGNHVDPSQFARVPHYRYQSLDTHTRIFL